MMCAPYLNFVHFVLFVVHVTSLPAVIYVPRLMQVQHQSPVGPPIEVVEFIGPGGKDRSGSYKNLQPEVNESPYINDVIEILGPDKENQVHHPYIMKSKNMSK